MTTPSCNLSLPCKQSEDSNFNLFEIECSSGGGAAIVGSSYGTDQFEDPGTGVYGNSDVGVGVQGSSQSGQGIIGTSDSSNGIQAQSVTGTALWATQTGTDADTLPDTVLAETTSNNHAAMAAHNYGKGPGVWAFSQNGTAIVATNEAGEAKADADAFVAFTSSPGHAAVAAHNDSAQNASVPSGFGVWASSNNTAIYGQGNPAGYFRGDVQVTGDLILINSPGSGDIAEDFDLEDESLDAEPGTVLVIHPTGRLSACTEPYDTRVAGVISGAGDLRPAITLQRLHGRPGRSPVALVGKVLCKVDAAFGEVRAGDLLTTSPSLGHAMRVTDRSRALGAVMGKALGSLAAGRGFVPILVSLR